MLTSRIQLQQLYWVSEGYQYFGQCVIWDTTRERKKERWTPQLPVPVNHYLSGMINELRMTIYFTQM